MPDAFTRHLRDAIAINLDRAPLYAEHSDGRSAVLSRRLVRLERAILPLAGWFDRRLDLESAFVPMNDLPRPETPPRWTSGGSVAAWCEASLALAALQFRAMACLARGRMDEVLVACRATFGRLESIETRRCVHLAMSRHLVESCARAALLARDGDRCAVARSLLVVQVAGLGAAPGLDRLAWRAHRVGVGILVNDLPCCLDLRQA